MIAVQNRNASPSVESGLSACICVWQFLDDHPGGGEIITEASGRDATEDYEDIGHSDEALNMLTKYKIGLLEVSVSRSKTPSVNFFA